MLPNPGPVSGSQLRRIRWAVRAALVLGIAASVAANVLHAAPNPIARAIAGWPPVALLLAVELVARVPVHRRLVALAKVAATAVIAAVAAWVSYWHMAGVAARYGEDAAAAHLLPLSVDGLVVLTSVCLVELAGQIRAVESTTEPEPARPPIPTIPQPTKPQVSLIKRPDQSDSPAPVFEPRGIDGADQRAAAVAALLRPDADPAAIAADAGVTVETLQRWADRAASKARRPRGGTRKPTPELAPVGVNGAEPAKAER